MSDKQIFDFSKIEDETINLDRFSFHMNHKIKLCQELSGINFSNEEVLPKKQMLDYQKCIEQTIRLDYDLTKRLVEIEEKMLNEIDKRHLERKA